MTRAIILVMDSFGVGASADAAAFGDQGADTFGHIAAHSANPLRLPNLARLGLGHIAKMSTGAFPRGFDDKITPQGRYGFGVELSAGKDTPSGHWEMMGVPVMSDWGYFPKTVPSFPKELTDALIREANLPGLLGDCHASGTEIIDQLGAEHVRTGKPIVYTSADSVFQIAAHEESFGLERLHEICTIARRLVDDYHIGRVIARPFIGTEGNYKRTGNRKDLAVLPPEPTLLDYAKQADRSVISIGKIADIFAHQGLTDKIKADGNDALTDATLDALGQAADGSIIFTNFVDFDTLYGHRRNVAGYAQSLEEFDRRLPDIERAMKPGDVAIITADHGCDPTWPGSDHTREHVPILAFGPGIGPAKIGARSGFVDIGQSLAQHLGLAPLPRGVSFLD